jgi:hypothetical protein
LAGKAKKPLLLTVLWLGVILTSNGSTSPQGYRLLTNNLPVRYPSTQRCPGAALVWPTQRPRQLAQTRPKGMSMVQAKWIGVSLLGQASRGA